MRQHHVIPGWARTIEAARVQEEGLLPLILISLLAGYILQECQGQEDQEGLEEQICGRSEEVCCFFKDFTAFASSGRNTQAC